jgi:zinc transporter ZupT
MLCGGRSRSSAWKILILIALMAIVGALVGLQLNDWLLGGIGYNLKSAWLGGALAFSAGNFIYIATGDLLPEAHRNRRDYGVPISVVFGFAINFLTYSLLSH